MPAEGQSTSDYYGGGAQGAAKQHRPGDTFIYGGSTYKVAPDGSAQIISSNTNGVASTDQATPAQPAPGSKGPGIGAGDVLGGGTPFLEGADMRKPGAEEQYYEEHKGEYTQPSMTGSFASDMLKKYGQGGPQVSNNSQKYFDAFGAPVISDEPGFGSYFDNAIMKGTAGINQGAAARGTYGTSTAMNRIGQLQSDLRGQQALKEADYNLNRLAEQRAWAGLGGTLAQNADISSGRASTSALDWLKGLGGLTGQADELKLAGLKLGQGAASGAQGAQRRRAQDAFNNMMGFGDALSGIVGDENNRAIATDVELLGNANQYATGATADARNAAQYNAQQTRADWSEFLKNAGNTYKFARGVHTAYDEDNS